MPGTHPKPRQKKYANKQLKKALNAVSAGMSLNKASVEFNVPKSTLRDNFVAAEQQGLGRKGHETILTKKEECLIAEWAKEMARRGFGRTPEEICEAVKQILDKAGRNVKEFRMNRPGKSWWWGFMRRHPDLHTAKPKPLELTRAAACTEDVVNAWFDGFSSFLQQNKITVADQVYNCDEAGFPLQACSSKKVCIDKLMKRTFHLTNPCKTSITTLQRICANGSVLPPAVYFPGKAFNPEYGLGFPKNVFIGFSNSGWMETYHFYAWMTNHFAKRIPPMRPVVLLIDGHISHIDYNTTVFCKENDILLFRLPPHTSHVIQPADRGFFNVCKNEWEKSCSRFSFENPGVVVNKRTFAQVFMEAFDKTARPDVVKSSFRCSGIWPVNRNAVDRSAFAPAKVFERNYQKPPSEISTKAASAPSISSAVTPGQSGLENSLAPSTSTPKKADDRHPVMRALEKIEEVVGPNRVRLFEARLEEGFDVEDDALYGSWKLLKIKCQKVKEGNN